MVDIRFFLLAASLSFSTAFLPQHTGTRTTASKASETARFSGASDESNSPSGGPGGLSRRQVGELAFAAAGLGITYAGTREVDPTDYGLWGILPLGPYKKKKTVKETIVPNKVWTLEQKFGILDVQVPLRMTVVKMSDGGLFVYDPIAATPECIDFVREIVAEHGPVKHIAVGSVALEHKAYAGVFAQKFPGAQVWLQPGQYSFPVDLPDSFLGYPKDRTNIMPATIDLAPADWQKDFDLATLGPIISRDGAFGETVFFHKDTHTLLVTDTALQASEDIPKIYETDHAPLLFHARDTVTDIVQDTPETLRKGWRRIQLFGLYFMPSPIVIKDLKISLDERRPDINSDFAGVYPWDWVGDEEASWRGLAGTSKSGGPLVAPILQVLLLNRSPVEILEFADKVAAWPIQRIIPAHLKNDLKFTGADYRKSFGFLEEQGVPEGFPKPLDADLQFLRDAEVGLLESGAVVKAPPKVGGKFSRAEIIAQTTYRCRGEICAPKAIP
jgi:hypothetical protein